MQTDSSASRPAELPFHATCSVLRKPIRQIIEAIKGLTGPPPTQEDIGWQPTDSAEIKD